MQKQRHDNKNNFKVRLYNYVLRLIKFLNALPQNHISREITNQLLRSGTSVGANYFEANGASSKKDFQNFFAHSLKSANESKFWIAILRDSDLVPQELNNELSWLFQETKELANILASSIITLKGKR